jgi:hypothetical protein
MGLQTPLDLHGVKVPTAYWRLTSFVWGVAEPLTVRLEIAAYASKAAFDEGRQSLETRSLTVDLTDANGNPDLVKVELLVRVRSLAYLEIKRFPEMEGALDV